VVKDERLELISEEIRSGIPVSFMDALAAIDYQDEIKREREANKWPRRLRRWLQAALGGGGRGDVAGR
jgi:hypothetical protein